MKTTQPKHCFPWFALCALGLMLTGCATRPARAAPAQASPATTASRAALACAVPSHCVNSFDTKGLGPLRFEGTPEQAAAALRATLAEFPRTKIMNADALSMEVEFTTFVGFKDLVDFRIDPDTHRIDYRSRSLVGKYDFGKNRSRMTEFSTRFEQKSKH